MGVVIIMSALLVLALLGVVWRLCPPGPCLHGGLGPSWAADRHAAGAAGRVSAGAGRAHRLVPAPMPGKLVLHVRDAHGRARSRSSTWPGGQLAGQVKTSCGSDSAARWLPPALAAAISGGSAARRIRANAAGCWKVHAAGRRVHRSGAASGAQSLRRSADRFEIDPRDHIAAQKARARQWRGHHRLLSFPSRRARHGHRPRDLAGAGEEDFLWLIAAGETLEAFVYLRGEFIGADWVTSSE